VDAFFSILNILPNNTVYTIFCYVLYFQISVFHTEEPLRDDYTLMDIAYIYTWRRVTLFTVTVIVLQFTC